MVQVQHFFDPETSTLTYVVFDPDTRDALVIDPVLDFDVATAATSTHSLDEVVDFVRERELRVHFVLETHAHADHLSGAQWLRTLGATVAIGARIREVQETFRDRLQLSVAIDGSQFDRLLVDGDVLEAGSLRALAIATPGHTPACLTYRIGDALFTGDALFMHDYGTGRCDFPSGSAADLYDSIQRLYAFPDETRVFPGHDYRPGDRALAWETTIGRSKRDNPQLSATTTKDAFIAMREARDRTLRQPRLLYQSIQVNIDGGRLPPYLVIPLGSTTERTIHELDPEEVSAYAASTIVDVREPDEFVGELGHIAGAQLVPLGTLRELSTTWDRDRAIILVCRSGARSARAVTDLAKQGFHHLFNLRGGMIAWNAAGMPVER